MGNGESSVTAKTKEGGYSAVSTEGNEGGAASKEPIVCFNRDVEFLDCLRREDWTNAIALVNYGANVNCSLDLLPSLKRGKVWSNRYLFESSISISNEKGLRYLLNFLGYSTANGSEGESYLSIKLGESKSPGSVLNYLCRALLRSEIAEHSLMMGEISKVGDWLSDGKAVDLINLVIDLAGTGGTGGTGGINAVDYQGYTALHHLARSDHPQLIKKLIESGADPEIKGNDGVSARQLITKYWRKSNRPIHTVLPPAPSVPSPPPTAKTSIVHPPSALASTASAASTDVAVVAATVADSNLTVTPSLQ